MKIIRKIEAVCETIFLWVMGIIMLMGVLFAVLGMVPY